MSYEDFDRREFLRLFCAFVALFGPPAIPYLQSNTTKQRTNVILILTDDQGFGDTGIHGNKLINTPCIDRLAKEGCEFSRFYVEPVCAPTRTSLLTGRYYYRTGVIHTSRGGAKMAGDETTIAEILQKAGYSTGMFGKWHLGDNYPMRPQDQGFDEALYHRGGGIDQTPDKPNSYFDPLLWKNGEKYHGKGYCTDIFFNEAMKFIEKNQSEAFFIYLPTNTPHTPLQVSKEYMAPYLAKGLDEQTARIYGMVKNIDDNIGRLLEFLKKSNLEDNTLIIFISDNGPNTARFNAGLLQRKSSVYEGGIRAISFFRWGKKQLGLRKFDRIAAHIDILPTVLDVCGVDVPPDLRLDGQSLFPLINESVRTESWPDRTLFIQCHRGLTPKKYQNCAAITQRYKMVGYPQTFGNEELETSEENPVLELYDLEKDMGEKNNLAKSYPAILEKLKREYNAWFEDVKATRYFSPGIIKLGVESENPATLCRYQDSHYIMGIPHGWDVEIVQSGQYKLSINRDQFTGKGILVVKWQGKEKRINLAGNTNSGIFDLNAGVGRLEIWFELEGVGRMTFSNNGTVGDVEVLKI